MAVAAAKPEVFTRNSSGLVRVMLPYSAFIYNILTMGLIFPWTYLWAPGAPAGRPARLGHSACDDLRDPHRARLRLVIDSAATLGRRLCVSEPGIRRRNRLLDRDVGVRDLDPAMGRSIGLAALLSRVCFVVSRPRRDYGQSDVDQHRRLVHHALGDHHREHPECVLGDVALGQRL